jgi:hypothetical protein
LATISGKWPCSPVILSQLENAAGKDPCSGQSTPWRNRSLVVADQFGSVRVAAWLVSIGMLLALDPSTDHPPAKRKPSPAAHLGGRLQCGYQMPRAADRERR